jgi:dTDP-glucose 4,6-dehydratase
VNPIGVRGVYDEAKRFAEAMTMAYHRYHGVDTHIIRIFNTYGERMRLDDGRVLPNFMGQALRGEPLTVYGDGSQTRSFCYVSDLVDGIYRLLSTDFHDPVNLGNPHEVTILEFARETIALTGSRSTIEFKPLPQDDPKVRRPDISRARKLLGWEPRIDRHEGMARTLAYFRGKVTREKR